MSTVRRVSVAEVAERLRAGSVVYLDVRSPVEFEQGHPPGAVNLPWMLVEGDRLVPNPDFERVVRANFALSQPLIVGCHSGARSRKCAAALLAAGYQDVRDMPAGFDGSRDAFGRLDPGWRRTSLPVEIDADRARTYAALLAAADPSAHDEATSGAHDER